MPTFSIAVYIPDEQAGLYVSKKKEIKAAVKKLVEVVLKGEKK